MKRGGRLLEPKLDREPHNKSHSARLEADKADSKWQAVIQKNRALARELGISGTPGFIVGNELVPGALDLNGLKELIARAGYGR